MPAIQARSLAKSFSGRPACWDVSFSVERGEVFGMLGPNGAGKTTTLRMLAGLLSPDSGEAEVAGQPVRPGAAGGPELRRRIGLLTEAPGFYDRLSARENLVLFGRLQGLSRAESDRRARPLLERFALGPHADRPFAVLSRGMKQKLAIARALLHEPEVVFLDEPTVGLDPEATAEVRGLIGELSAESRTIVLCTHHLDEVERLCSRAAFIAGRLLAVHDLRQAPHAGLKVELAAPHPGADGLLRALPEVVAATQAERTLQVELADAAPEAVAQGAATVVAALVAAGARVAAVVPSGPTGRERLEQAWLQLQRQARGEGLIG